MTAPRTRAGASKISALRRRSRAACVLATALVALAAAGCGSAGAGAARPSASAASAASSASSPSCLASALDPSAKLAGVPVDVSPAPGTDTADPQTQISFLGVPATQIRAVSVVGQSSGQHSGSLVAYSQGDGASFVPDEPFKPGEEVAVHAVIGATAGGTPVSFGFRVDTPYSTAHVKEFPNPTAAPTDYQSFDTLPGVQAPILTVTAPDRDPSAGDIFTTTSSGPGRYGPLIYTPQGQLVWFDQLSGGLTAEDLNLQSYEGQSDLTFWQGKVLSLGFGQGEDIVMNSGYKTVATVKGGNGLQADLHEFQIAPNNIAYVTAYNPIHCDLASAQGPSNGVVLDAVIEEIDMKTGLVRWEWHSLDHVRATDSETSPPKSSPWDWFHLNSIDPESNGDIFISARNTWAGYQIQGGTGQILWTLGGLDSSFKMGLGTKTWWQHDGRILADGEVTFFDDGSSQPEEYQSRAVRIALDFKTHEARLVSAYTHPSPPLLAASQGNMQTLSNGNIVVNYGGIPETSEYSKDGSLLFDAHLSYTMTSYRGYRFPWSGHPASPPAVVANLNNTRLETIVHMSWNGATGVTSWRVLAGKSSQSTQPQTTVRSTGFESSTILLKSYGYVTVEALDSAGQVLGTSQTVAVKSYAASFPTGQRSG
jgi:hypothetical protein